MTKTEKIIKISEVILLLVLVSFCVAFLVINTRHLNCGMPLTEQYLCSIPDVTVSASYIAECATHNAKVRATETADKVRNLVWWWSCSP